jgi:hypothetical protein
VLDCRLAGYHLRLNADAATRLLGDATRVLVARRAEDGALLLAPSAERHLLRFNPGHCESLVKLRNAHGDKAVALHELYAEHHLAPVDADVPLDIETDDDLGLVILRQATPAASREG